jgi:hypothetical protein
MTIKRRGIWEPIELRPIDKITKRYYWPRMRRDIICYVRSCADCQSKKRPLERPAGLKTPIRYRQPFEKVGIDLIGPFPLSKSGNRHVIVAVDYLTKWVITKQYPLLQQRILSTSLSSRLYNNTELRNADFWPWQVSDVEFCRETLPHFWN